MHIVKVEQAMESEQQLMGPLPDLADAHVATLANMRICCKVLSYTSEHATQQHVLQPCLHAVDIQCCTVSLLRTLWGTDK